MPERDFADWGRKNAKRSTFYKTYAEMVTKSSTDAEAFRSWAKTSSAGRKDLDDLLKTAKAKALGRHARQGSEGG